MSTKEEYFRDTITEPSFLETTNANLPDELGSRLFYKVSTVAERFV